jgi:hypothetical protein
MSLAAMRFRHASALLLMVIALVACAHPAVQARPPPYPSAPPAAVLDRLLADYRALGLPLPPPNAWLVRWDPDDGRIMGPDHRAHPIIYLAFELPDIADGSRHHLLVGTEELIGTLGPNNGSIVRVEPTIEAAEGIRDKYAYPWDHSTMFRRPVVYATNAALATAIQAKARGWDALAERLLAVASTNIGNEEACHELPGAPPRQALALLARAHFALEWNKPGADRAAIARRLTAAVAFDPILPHCECSWFVRVFGLPKDICGRE